MSKINKDFHEHENYLQMIRKMDSKNNKMKVKGLEKLSREKLQQLPHINEISRGGTRQKSTPRLPGSKTTQKRSQSLHFNKDEKDNSHIKQNSGERTDRGLNENEKFQNEFLE